MAAWLALPVSVILLVVVGRQVVGEGRGALGVFQGGGGAWGAVASLAVGLAVVVPVLVGLGLAGWGLGPGVCGGVLGVLAVAGWVANRGGAGWMQWGTSGEQGGVGGSGWFTEPRWLVGLSGGVLALAVGVAAWKILAMPVWSWDHFVIWGLKARRIAAQGSLDLAFLAEPQLARASPDYPLGLPLAWVLLGLGTIPGAGLFKAVHLLFAAGLLAAVRRAATRLAGSGAVGNGAAAFVALSPLLWDTTNVGLADLPLAFFATTAVALLVAPSPRGPWSFRGPTAAGLLVGFLPWLKDEGLPLALLLAAAGTFWIAHFGIAHLRIAQEAGRGSVDEEGRSPGRWRRACAFLGPAAFLAAAVPLIDRLFLPESVKFLQGDWFGRAGERLAGTAERAGQAGEILAAVGRELGEPGFLGFWWIFPLAALVVLGRRDRLALPLAAVVVVQLGLYVAIFFATSLPPLDHVGSALHRIASALVPLGVLPVAAALAPRRRDGGGLPPGAGRVEGMNDRSAPPASGPFAFVREFAAGLRYPQLFFLTAGLFGLDLLVPDLVPFVDEILLGLLTLLLARVKERGRPGNGGAAPGGSASGEREPRVKNVTPPKGPKG